MSSLLYVRRFGLVMSICAILVPTSFFSGHYLVFFRMVVDGMVGCLPKGFIRGNYILKNGDKNYAMRLVKLLFTVVLSMATKLRFAPVL